MNVNKHITTDNLDVMPPAQAGPWSITPTTPRTTWDVVAARGAVGILAGVVGWWLLPPVAAYAALVIGAAWALKRFVLSDRIGGVEIRTWRNDVRGTDIVGPLGMAAVEHARRALPNVSSYSPSIQQLPAPKVPASADTVEGQVIEAQPELIQVDAWLPWLTDEMSPHLLLIGKTRTGKSTLADIILAFRARRGDAIAILDPHWSTQDKYGNRKWGGIAPMARTVPELRSALRALKAEYEERKRRMALPASDPQFTPEGCFAPLTILIDEVPEVVTELAAIPKAHLDHGIWGETVKIFGSGGAKVNMSVILLSQSPNVEDIGINGKMRENFVTIALANMARPFIDRYASKSTKPQLYLLLGRATREGMLPAELPAAAEYSGECKVLSRDGILSHRATAIDADVWQSPRQLDPPTEYARASVAYSQPSATLRATAPVQVENGSKVAVSPVALRSATSVASFNDAQRDELVRILRRRKNAQGRPFSQDFIRGQLERAGLTIAQQRLVDLCQEVDRA